MGWILSNSIHLWEIFRILKWRYVSIICLAIFWYPLGLKIGIFLIVGTSNLGSWNGYWKPIYTYLFESQLIQSNLITDMLTGSVTQSRSPCSPDALSICCCPANSWATDPPRRWGVSHFCGPWCCWWVFTQRRRSILICIYIYILCMYTVYVYMYTYDIYIYMCVCVWSIINENNIICTLIHKMFHSDPWSLLQATPSKMPWIIPSTAPQATPSHPAKQAHFATWGHGMRGFSQGSPDMLIRFNW